jgi:hypothetical protein
VIVKVMGVPVHVVPPLLNEGVTVTVATTGEVPTFIAAKLAILPVPLAARPIEGWELVHEYVVVPPVLVVVKVTAVVAPPLQTTWLPGLLT